MGIGDEIMASGQARQLHIRTAKRVLFTERDGRPRWSEMWNGLNYILRPSEATVDCLRIANAPGCRPYIEYPFDRETGCRFSGWRARDHLGEISFTIEERAFANRVAAEFPGFIVLEPTLKAEANPNKQWGWARWQQLADLLKGWTLIQLGPQGCQTLDGVVLIQTSSFRFAAAVLARARLAVLPEGGLHHAAAVMGVPTVVLFGGSPDVNATGYPHQRNIVPPGAACGNWLPCKHCDTIWEELTAREVAYQAAAELNGGSDGRQRFGRRGTT